MANNPGAEIHTFKMGETIFKEGDNSTCIYLVQSGVISVRKKKGQRFVEIAKVREKEVIGELAFLDRQPRSATAVAVTAVELLEVPFETLEGPFSKMPDYVRRILAAVANRLRQADEIIRNYGDAIHDEGRPRAEIKKEGD